MEQICPSEYCTGCMACYNSCNHHAIVITEDCCGFRFPVIDLEKCVQCGLCTSSCPVNFPLDTIYPMNVYAAFSKDYDDLMSSTSGGASSIFSQKVISQGGVVYGCAEHSYSVINHIRIDKKGDLHKIKGSKYVQSDIGEVFRQVKKDLLNEKQVLFIGTPCQVAGIRSFLRRDYAGLITIDLVCHGVPSGKLLQDNVHETLKRKRMPLRDYSVRFRSKDEKTAEHKYIFALQYEECKMEKEYPHDYYLAGFISGLFHRECCYSCKYANPCRVSDITIGDYWGIGKTSLNTRRGVSAVLMNSKKGLDFFEKCKGSFEYEERELEEAIRGNGQLQQPSLKNKNYELFRKLYPRLGFTKSVRRCLFSFYVHYYVIESVRNRLRRNSFIYSFYRSIKKFI